MGECLLPGAKEHAIALLHSFSGSTVQLSINPQFPVPCQPDAAMVNKSFKLGSAQVSLHREILCPWNIVNPF
jgi:hypothetical protein